MLFQSLPMRALLFAFVAMTSISQTVVAEEIPWSTDIEGSLQQAADSGRPVLMEFTADWCMYCKRMEKTTFVDPRVVSFVNQHYVAVRIDADEHKQLVTDLDIKGLPAILVVSPTLQIIERIPGFQTPEALLAKLNRSSGGNRQQVAQNGAANRQAQQPVVARPASSAAAVPAPSPKPELQFEAIESEKPVAQESAEEEFQPEFEAVAEQDTFEPASQEPEEEMTVEAAAAEDNSESAVDEDFFATVSQKKLPEPKTPARKVVPGEVIDEPEFDGHCLVTAVESREIIDGSPRHQTKYRGHVLNFSSEEAKQTFLANPNDYWPLFDGICSVAMLNDEERVMGKLEYAAFFRKRLWLFSTEENLKQFLEDPADVAEEMQELAESRSAR
jgi:thioredoxin-related protein/YHS domain-containing protein